MSVQAMTWAFDQDAPTWRAKFVLIILADSAGPDGSVVLDIEQTRLVTKLSRGSVIGALSDLEEAGLIKRKEEGVYALCGNEE